MNEDIVAIVGFFSTVIIIAFGYPLVTYWIRRKERNPTPPPIDRDRGQRLERIEHAIEAMAIEVERISEGQRFVTKLLSEQSRAPAREHAALPPRTD